ncbi:hypothetical protein [Streptomyces sp. NPDC058739]|uniref:hypothetical protein n=1 Tax=Streptomyces sp. NPDC058739 TaxID=3346618 RepID=UPI003691A275
MTDVHGARHGGGWVLPAAAARYATHVTVRPATATGKGTDAQEYPASAMSKWDFESPGAGLIQHVQGHLPLLHMPDIVRDTAGCAAGDLVRIGLR